jgi:phytoene dehydrogenase-like protein
MHALTIGADAGVQAAEVPDSFDVIVIGSGVGGLASASLLAQLRGLRVAVLERHFRLGGYAQRFRRPGRCRWDPGLHYMGQLQEGTDVRALMDLVTGGAVRWRPLPSPFERYHLPDRVVDQPAGVEEYRDALVNQWPREASAIGRYFAAIELATQWYVMRFGGAGLPRSDDRGARSRPLGIPLMTTKEVLDACGLRAPDLRATLAAQWGDYGVPPAQSAFAAHAMVVSHFIDGAWFPEGGGEAIVRGAQVAIEAAGGVCLVNHEVEEVLIERGRAVGVRLSSGSRSRRERRVLRARTVISDAGATNTFFKLLADPAAQCAAEREHIARLPDFGSAVQLFVSFRESPECLGVAGENHWLFAGLDHDELYAQRNSLLDGEAMVAFVSFPSLNDPHTTAPSAGIVAGVDRAAFEPWADLPWMRRGADYDDLKARIAEALLRFVDRHVPGFSDLVETAELATPLSFEHFTGHPGAAIYGLPVVPERFLTDRVGVETPVRGLLLTGSDVFSSGIVGAAVGGAVTAGHVLGAGGFHRIMAAVRAASRPSPNG